MKHARSIALVSAGAAVTLAFVSPSASAATTTVHAGDAAGAAYAGNVRATLTSPLVSTTALGSATCDTGTVDATVQSDGTGLNVSVLATADPSDAELDRSSAFVSADTIVRAWSDVSARRKSC